MVLRRIGSFSHSESMKAGINLFKWFLPSAVFDMCEYLCNWLFKCSVIQAGICNELIVFLIQVPYQNVAFK
jgi:hypothetical protein